MAENRAPPLKPLYFQPTSVPLHQDGNISQGFPQYNDQMDNFRFGSFPVDGSVFLGKLCSTIYM